MYTKVYVYCFPSEQRTLPRAPQRSLRLEGENPFGFWPTPASIHPYLNFLSPFWSYPITSSRRIPLPQLLIPLVVGWMVAPKKICSHSKSSNYGCCLIWKRVFKDVINLRILRLLWIIQMGPKFSNKCPCKKGRGRFETDRRADTNTQRTRQSEDGAKGWNDGATCQGMPQKSQHPPKDGRIIFRLSPTPPGSRERRPCQYLNFRLLASKTMKENISIFLSHKVFANVL